MVLICNDPGGSRTRDLRIKSPLLYQLSYRVVYAARNIAPLRIWCFAGDLRQYDIHNSTPPSFASRHLADALFVRDVRGVPV